MTIVLVALFAAVVIPLAVLVGIVEVLLILAIRNADNRVALLSLPISVANAFHALTTFILGERGLLSVFAVLVGGLRAWRAKLWAETAHALAPLPPDQLERDGARELRRQAMLELGLVKPAPLVRPANLAEQAAVKESAKLVSP